MRFIQRTGGWKPDGSIANWVRRCWSRFAGRKGIPARIVSGYLLYPVSPAHHYWAEAWVNGGWLALDTIRSDLSSAGRDRPWRNHFFGRLDYRMKTQCLPRFFNATPAIRFPAAWHMLARPDGEGAEIGFYANESGALVYRGRLSVRRA